MNTRLRSWFSRITEPQILFPLFSILVFAMLWGTTLKLIRIEYVNADQTAISLSREVAGTYEAQIVRAMREIDQTLKMVKYTYELKGDPAVLNELKTRNLLPPDLLFSVTITDAAGNMVAVSRSSETPSPAAQEYLRTQLENDDLIVSLPIKNPKSGDWTLQFSRRLHAPNGSFSGFVIVSVDAAYFVSGYETSKLGEHGVLAVLGTDGVFRIRRSGDSISAGDQIDYATVAPKTDSPDDEVTLSANPWDSMRRYTVVLPLYNLPLAVIVGLSEEEQLAATIENRNTYLWRAGVGSVLLLLVIGVLWKMSTQLVQSRQRESEARIAHAERIEYLAYHDGLTTLPNRSLFTKLLSQSMSHALRYKKSLAVLFLDLDRFKQINDTLGHDAGDQLLQEVSIRLKNCLRESDTVARLGGDEFVVLLPELDEEKYATTVAQKILAAVAQPFMLIGQEFRVTASIGISTYPNDGLDEQTLTKNADIAMYHAKEEGKNNFQFYSEQLNHISLERLTLESSLRNALARNEFELHYQAKRDIRTGRIKGMEALLRWHHPDLGIVPPMQFIPVAEEMKLMVAIGKWVLKTACRQNMAWQRTGLPRLSIAINLNEQQFTDVNLLRDITFALEESGMAANLLELEITESMLMREIDKNIHILTALKGLGVRIAVDDFGTGYSSLAALKQFPLDTIKIDRSFVRDVSSVTSNRNLTEAIIAMGQSLSLTVVAQGVETKEQADFLRLNACDEIQGFYFNEPLPADQFTEVLQHQDEVEPVI